MRAQILTALVEHGKQRVDEMLGVEPASPAKVIAALSDCLGNVRTPGDAFRMGQLFSEIESVRKAFLPDPEPPSPPPNVVPPMVPLVPPEEDPLRGTVPDTDLSADEGPPPETTEETKET